jgi:hypothetical protein
MSVAGAATNNVERAVIGYTGLPNRVSLMRRRVPEHRRPGKSQTPTKSYEAARKRAIAPD